MVNLKKYLVIICSCCLVLALLSGCAGAGATGNAASEGGDYAAKTGESFGAFKTVDLEGNEITEDIFSENDYTMVNIWGTFCGPCIAEMPQLEEVYENLPENIGLIGVVCDLYFENEDENVKNEADEIVDTTGVEYKSLLLWEGGDKLISEITSVVPTTIFVDSEGNIVGDPIFGADIKAYESRIAHLAGESE